MSRRRIAVTISADGTIKAETLGITGDGCLDYIPLLEDLLEAQTVESAFTADHRATGEQSTVQSTGEATGTTETVGERHTP